MLFAALFLIVAAIPLRRGERWAWWSCWLIVLAFATFGTIFGAHDSQNLVAAIMVALALITLWPRSTSAC